MEFEIVRTTSGTGCVYNLMRTVALVLEENELHGGHPLVVCQLVLVIC